MTEMQQSLELSCRGLYTQPNQFNDKKVPQGALNIAKNVVLDRDNMIESRRGQFQYGDQLTVGLGSIDKLFEYKDTLIVNYNNKLAYDSNGSGAWLDYLGTYYQPSPKYKINSLEANGNFYFTSSTGIYKLDELTSTPIQAGAPEALGGQATLTGASGFLGTNAAVAYRVVYGYDDANQNRILGAPSQRIIVSNATASSANVSITVGIPDGVTSNYFFQLYRSPETLTATDEPSDELQLVHEGNVTPAMITAKSLTYVDNTPDDLRGAALYTNSSQEGIQNANTQPPFASDISLFNQATFYSNTRSKNTREFTIISVGAPAGLSYTVATGGVSTIGLPTITGLSNTANMVVGQKVEATGFSSTTKIVSVDSSSQITVSENASASGTGLTVSTFDVLTIGGVEYYAASTQDISQNKFAAVSTGSVASDITNAALSLVDVINKTTDNTTLYAYYQSGISDLPGRILIKERNIGGAQFVLNSSKQTAFNPVIPLTGNTVISSNDTRQNRVYFSKTQQPEAVPVLNYLDVGSEDYPIDRIVTLRDALFVFKGVDGIYRITGNSASSYSVSLLDNTTTVRAPETVHQFNNQIFCFSNQGVVAVSDQGVQVISRPIEMELLELSSANYPAFDSVSFAIPYESARHYILYTVSSPTDTTATQAFVYNYVTQSWFKWDLSRSCGLVSNKNDKMYSANPVNDYMYEERKSFNLTDYADEQYVINIVSSNNLVIDVTSTANLVPGMTITQAGIREAIITQVLSPTQLVVDRPATWAVGAATAYVPIDCEVEFLPQAAGNVGINKHFREITYIFKNAAFNTIEAGFSTNLSLGREITILEARAANGWGEFGWGQQPWGGSVGGEQVIRTYVPREKQLCAYLKLYLRSKQAFTSMQFCGYSILFENTSSRIR